MNRTEQRILDYTIRAAIAAGYTLAAVDDGGDTLYDPTPNQVFDRLEAVEEGYLYLSSPGPITIQGGTPIRRHMIWFIWGNGNGGRDCWTDNTDTVDFEVKVWTPVSQLIDLMEKSDSTQVQFKHVMEGEAFLRPNGIAYRKVNKGMFGDMAIDLFNPKSLYDLVPPDELVSVAPNSGQINR